MDEFIASFPKIMSIFGLAFFYFWPAIPAGLALGLSPVVVIGTTSLSYVSGVAAIALLGSRVREWILKRLGKKTILNTNSLLGRVWGRFGTIGLGLAAPMTVGSQAGTAIGIALDARPLHLVIWMCVGAVGWSSLLTVLVLMGLFGAQTIMP